MDNQQPQQEKHSELQIHQQAGDGATQIGQVLGDLYISNITDYEIDLSAYQQHLQSQFAIWKQRYTLLDVDPMVSVVGQDLKPLSNAQTPVTQAVQKHERLIIIGDAGSGKTTSLHFIAQETTEERSEEGEASATPSPVCVYIELGGFRMSPEKSPLQSLLDLIAKEFHKRNASPQPPSSDTVHEFLSNHQCLLLFDGLNETQAEIRSSCLQAINDCAQRYPNHRYVLTTRPHGFSPLQNWDIVALRELNDQQIKEFLTRYTDEETADTLLQSVLDAQNPLLRLPLFLTFVLRMRNLPLTELQTRINSRSGIIDSYVRHLIERDTQGKYLAISDHRLDHIYSILSHLADQIQHSGQTLPLQEAISSISQHASLTSQEAERIVNMLCERGVLSTDRYYVRFWHHTIQEYFYAGRLVARWRDARKSIRKPPRWLRRILRQSHEEDALVYMIAHLSDQELKRTLLATSKENPGLAMLWADDLMAEQRCMEEVERSLIIVRKLSLVARRYSKLSTKRGGAASNLFVLLFILCGVANILFSEDPFSFSLTLSNIDIAFFIIYLVLLPIVLLHYPGTHRLEALFGVTLNIRDNTLQNRLISIAQEIRQSWLTAGSIKDLALSITRFGMRTDLMSWLKRSTSLYIDIRRLEYERDPLVLPVCAYLFTYNNAYSYAALQTLIRRADRFSEEKETIIQLAWGIWRNIRISWRVRKLAGQFLHQNKEIQRDYYPAFIRGYLSQVAIFLMQIILNISFLCIPFFLLSAIGFVVGAIAEINRESSSWGYITILIGSLTAWVIPSILVWLNVRKCGAKRIPGYKSFDAWSPWQYFLVFIIFPFLSFSYIVVRNGIRRNVIPIDWDDLEKYLSQYKHHLITEKSRFQEVRQAHLTADGIEKTILNLAQEDIEADIVSLLKNSTSLYRSIQTLGYVIHPLALSVCKYLLTYNNAYSHAALEALTQRANHFLEERATITQLMWTIWRNPQIDLRLRKLAGQYLHRYKEIHRKDYYIWIWYYLSRITILFLLTAVYTGFFYGLLIGIEDSLLSVGIGGIGIEDSLLSVGISAILCVLIPAMLIWIDARKSGAKRIPGYAYFDAWHPWQYFLLGLIALNILVAAYILSRNAIRRNAIQINWQELEEYLHKSKNISMSEKSIAQEIHQSQLITSDIKDLVVNIPLFGTETDIISWLKKSPSLYESIQRLGERRHPQVLPVCEYFLTYNNAYSYAALQALIQRADRFSEEKDRITEWVWHIWQNTKITWKFRKLAGLFLHQNKEIRRDYYTTLIRTYLSQGAISLLLIILNVSFLYLLFSLPTVITGVVGAIAGINRDHLLLNGTITSDISLLTGLLIAWVMPPILVWLDARKVGAKRIPGYRSFDAWSPWQYSLLLLVFPFMLFRYILIRNRIQRNMIQVEWEKLETYLRQDQQDYLNEKSIQEISQTRFLASDIKELASSITQFKIKTDIASLLQKSPILYKSIQKFGYVTHPMVLPVCKYFLTYNNAYSYAALQALTQRATRFSEEKDTIIQLVRGIWQNTDMNWKIRKLAGQFLHRYKEIQGNYYPVLIRKHLFQGTSLLLLLVLYAIFSISFILLAFGITGVAGTMLDIDMSLLTKQIEDNSAESILRSIIIAWVIPPILVWLDAKKIGAKWIPGYRAFDALYPWQYSLLLIVSPFMLFRYISIQDKIQRNVIQIAWEELEKYLKLCEHTSMSEKSPTHEPDQSRLTSQDISDPTGNIPQPDMVTDIVSWLKESTSPYMTIQRLEHIRHPLVLPSCEHLFTYNNAYSYAALQLLMRRATHFSDEKETITQVIWGIWENTKMSLRLRKLAGKYLYRHKELRGNYYTFLLRYYLFFFFIPAGVYYLFLAMIGLLLAFLARQIIARTDIFSLIERVGVIAFSIILLILLAIIFLVIPMLVWINARKIRIKRIPGYRYFDAWHPWQYCLRCVTGFFLGVPAMYVFMRNAIRRNTIQIDWDELEKHLRKYKKNSISEEEMEE